MASFSWKWIKYYLDSNLDHRIIQQARRMSRIDTIVPELDMSTYITEDLYCPGSHFTPHVHAKFAKGVAEYLNK